LDLDKSTSCRVISSYFQYRLGFIHVEGVDALKYVNERSFAIVTLCGIVGILLAITIQILNTSGIIVDEFITGSITLREVQAMTIIIWLLLGVGISATQ